MYLWIADSDISFSYNLKQTIEKWGVKHANPDDPFKILVFHDGPSLFEVMAKAEKETQRRPRLVFLNANLPDGAVLSSYRKWEAASHWIVPSVQLFASRSYGLGRSVSVLSRKDLEKKILTILEEHFSGKEKTLPVYPKDIPAFLGKQYRDHLKACEKDLADWYYRGALHAEDDLLKDIVADMADVAEWLQFDSFMTQADRLLQLLEGKKLSNRIKLKKEVKDLLNAAEKILKTDDQAMLKPPSTGKRAPVV